MRASAVILFFVLLLVPSAVGAQDALAEARRHYNSGDYDAAERAARTAAEQPTTASPARVVLGRTLLERFRRSAAASDLGDARAALRDADPRALDGRERLELTLGFAETLFLEDRFAAAADLFEPVIDASRSLGAAAHERVLDWWATALDRHAQTRAVADRSGTYARIASRMHQELARDSASAPASYWLVAAARGSGDLDGAAAAATAAWIRATLARDRGVALRGDLDRLMIQAIIPERAARMASRDSSAAVAGLLAEWESFKASWSR